MKNLPTICTIFPFFLLLLIVSKITPETGQRKGDMSKIVKKCLEIFRHFRLLLQGKKNTKARQKVSETTLDIFRQLSRGTNFPALFVGL